MRTRLFQLSRLWIIASVALAACTPSLTSGMETLVADPTPVISNIQSSPPISNGEDIVVHPTPLAYQDESPLRPTFQVSESSPDILWRAPLQEIPLAINPNDHFYFSRPIAADQVNWPLGDYRYGYLFPGMEIVHYGIDIDASQGAPVLAAGPGRVVFAGFGLQNGHNDPEDPYGKAVMIKHDFGYNSKVLYTVYGHMDRVDVIDGQRVETGTQLGIVGNTGATTGPHLHFEVRVGGLYSTFQNPELWVVPPQDMGIIAARIMDETGDPITSLDVKLTSLSTGKNYYARTYTGYAFSEPVFRENLARGDIPTGAYTIQFEIDQVKYSFDMDIAPATVNYFSFQVNKKVQIGHQPESMSTTWTDSLMP